MSTPKGDQVLVISDSESASYVVHCPCAKLSKMGRKSGKQSQSFSEIEEEEVAALPGEKDEKAHNPFPYPTYVNVSNFVSVKLSGESDYSIWKAQMMCLIEAHDMLDFINKTFKKVSKNKDNRDAQMPFWLRSDALLRGWILGSLTKDVIHLVMDLKTTRELWKKLEHIFGSTPRMATPNSEKATSAIETSDSKGKQLEHIFGPMPGMAAPKSEKATSATATRDSKDLSDYMPLHKAAQKGKWDEAQEIFNKDQEAITARINKSGYIALHLAVGTHKLEVSFVQKLLGVIRPEKLMELQTYKNQTPLHIAAIVGNTEAVKILVSKNSDLLYTMDKDGFLPVHRAVFNSHKRTFLHLLEYSENHLKRIGSIGQMTFGKDKVEIIKIEEEPFSGQSGLTLLTSSIIAGYYDVAMYLVKRYPELATTIPSDMATTDAPLMAIAKKTSAFYSGTNYNFLQRLIYPYVPVKKDVYSYNANQDDIENQGFSSQVIKLKADGDLSRESGNDFNLGWHVKRIQKDKLAHHQSLELVRFLCEKIQGLNKHSCYSNYYTEPVIEAACNGAYEVVQEIVETFPEAAWCKDKHGYYIVQLAILNRCEKVYNLMVYHMSEHTHFYKTVKDASKNNILHLAARLAPKDKLEVMSGAALQMQHELQWFQEVESMKAKFVTAMNSDKETPKMVFAREHKDLVQKGEDWMKNTANSYTITAALIVTMVFAAAITVPGGTNGDTGKPIFEEKTAFAVFAISDAISLFTSTTSLLLFLSILTERYAEHDFLFTLPTRLAFGLIMLILSTAAMMTAFSATLYLMFGRGQEWILIPIVLLACLPISSFVTLQGPLLADLIFSTYGRGIFGEQSEPRFHLSPDENKAY